MILKDHLNTLDLILESKVYNRENSNGNLYYGAPTTHKALQYCITLPIFGKLNILDFNQLKKEKGKEKSLCSIWIMESIRERKRHRKESQILLLDLPWDV